VTPAVFVACFPPQDIASTARPTTRMARIDRFMGFLHYDSGRTYGGSWE
jgi:hypothetical protein